MDCLYQGETMTNTQRYSLWQNDFVSQVNENTFVVKNRFTGALMIKRFLSADSYPVMKKISEISCVNLMTIYDVDLVENRCVCLCEYIEGMSLFDAVKRYGTYNTKQAENILLAVINGLSSLHKCGIVHRDIKPENVMINKYGIVKIIDYDISRVEKERKSKDTEILGTVGYASPEQFGFSQTDEKADIYSCGVLLNFLLTGKLVNEQLHRGKYQNVILRCVEIDKDKRYKNVDELKKALLGEYVSDRKIRPLFGFRSKHIFPKIVTTLAMIVYFIMLSYYIYAFITQDAGIRSNPIAIQIRDFFVLFVLFTALPYILFGDIGRISYRLCPNNHQKGRYIEIALAVLSLAVGFLILIFSV